MFVLTGTILDEAAPRARLAVLLQHFSRLGDDREPWRIMYPLKEVMLLIVCATIAGCDDFDEICAWGRHHLDFLRGFSEFHYGIPCERWLRKLVNRIDPILFGRCFQSWIAALWPDRHDLIAIDGKMARRTQNIQPMYHPIADARVHRIAPCAVGYARFIPIHIATLRLELGQHSVVQYRVIEGDRA